MRQEASGMTELKHHLATSHHQYQEQQTHAFTGSRLFKWISRSKICLLPIASPSIGLTQMVRKFFSAPQSAVNNVVLSINAGWSNLESACFAWYNWNLIQYPDFLESFDLSCFSICLSVSLHLPFLPLLQYYIYVYMYSLLFKRTCYSHHIHINVCIDKCGYMSMCTNPWM